ncbi:MAG: GNAT family N-acetyltransferase, partial [Planctomycetaceae bacterium]|nr:GNAT family N-acetyltransferase [Planctomycetaceae bacterium]
MSQATIREPDWNDPADCEAVVHLIDAYAQEPIEGAQPLPTSSRERLIDGLRNEPGGLVLLATVDEQPVGIAVCFRGFSTFAAQPLINIHDLAVLSEHRNRGIGSRLLEEVCRRA